MSVTVVSCLYGDRGYQRFASGWDHAISQLDPRPDDVLVFADRAYNIPHAHVYVIPRCPWWHPQAFYLQRAVENALTEWVWIVDIDDIALPDGLEGLDEVEADVWTVGYLPSDGDPYIPPRMSAEDVLDSPGNLIPAGSMIRTEAFHAAGGFPDVAFQDWALWRRLAANGATFAPSTRAHYRYQRHDGTRSAVELRRDLRDRHLAEMLESETRALA